MQETYPSKQHAMQHHATPENPCRRALAGLACKAPLQGLWVMGLLLLGGWPTQVVLAQVDANEPTPPRQELEIFEIPVEDGTVFPELQDPPEAETQPGTDDFLLPSEESNPRDRSSDINSPDINDAEGVVPGFPERFEVEGQVEGNERLLTSPGLDQPDEPIFPPRFPQEDEEAEAEPEEIPEDEFPPNPLELTESDPLLPNPVVERPLSPLELLYLRQALNALNVEAQAQLAAGNRQQAFQIWYRELRLRRVLGYEEEVPALGRVGEYAWAENDSEAVQLITARLEEIEADLQQQQPLNFALLLSIADSYQALRNYESAVRLYEQILEQARLAGDTAVEESTLMSLADLHLGWFYFAKAAEVYEVLLIRARQRGDSVREQDILTQLAYAYQQGEQYEQAIATLQQQLEWYREVDPLRLPPIQIALGNSYREVQQPGPAANAYQAAYAAALAQQQYGLASDALKQLASLYQALGRPNDALVVYRLLQSVQLESYDRFGIMEAFSSMGRIYQEQGQTGEAIANYRQALQLAVQMDYPGRIRYFQEQLASLTPAPVATSEPQTDRFSGFIPYEPREIEFGNFALPGVEGDRPPADVAIPSAPAVEVPVINPENATVFEDAPTLEENERPPLFEPFGPP